MWNREGGGSGMTILYQTPLPIHSPPSLLLILPINIQPHWRPQGAMDVEKESDCVQHPPSLPPNILLHIMLLVIGWKEIGKRDVGIGSG